jgi:hypothetical protein
VHLDAVEAGRQRILRRLPIGIDNAGISDVSRRAASRRRRLAICRPVFKSAIGTADGATGNTPSG